MQRVLFFITALSVFLFASQSQAYEEINVINGGSLSGIVLFTGKKPSPVTFPVKKDREVCKQDQFIVQDVKTDASGLLGDVLVYISDIEKGKSFPKVSGGYEIIQEQCTFKPFLQAVQYKSNLSIVSKDMAGHNIHAYETDGVNKRTLFNLAQPTPDVQLNVMVRPRKSPFIKLECDNHEFMKAWIYVTKTPYYDVVHSDGTFVIDSIPPGLYKVNAWHPYLGITSQIVSVTSNGKVTLQLQFEETKPP